MSNASGTDFKLKLGKGIPEEKMPDGLIPKPQKKS